MRVTLIRHAEAGDDAPRDESRALTARGRADARRLGRALARRGVRFSLIVTSPLVRAVQTAEIVAAAIGYRGRMPATDLLVPEAAAARRGRVPRDRSADETSVALVAHEPILSAVAAALTRKAAPPAAAQGRGAAHPAARAGPTAAGALRWRVDGGTRPPRAPALKRRTRGVRLMTAAADGSR